MNWGLFATLAGFLLPLSLFVRVATNLARAPQPLGRPAQACRAALLLLLLLAIPITGKAASVTFALSGRYGDVGQLTIDFMETPWGLAHLALTIAAIVACDVVAPRVMAQLETPPFSGARPTAAYLKRDAGLLLVLLGVAWLGAR